MAAKGLAKAEGPDAYSWRIVAGSDGAVTVNGNALSGMGPPASPHAKGAKPRRTRLEP